MLVSITKRFITVKISERTTILQEKIVVVLRENKTKLFINILEVGMCYSLHSFKLSGVRILQWCSECKKNKFYIYKIRLYNIKELKM